MPEQGIETGRFGKRLYDYCKSHDLPYDIYYDHGNKAVDPHVAVPKGFYGERISRKNWLVDGDVIAGSKDGKAILLIEIEERPASPKKILGNILAIMMCNKFAVKVKREQKYYRVTENTHLFLACLYKEKGFGMEKIENLRKRIKEIDGFPEGIPSKNMSFILENNLNKLIKKLEDNVIKFLESNWRELHIQSLPYTLYSNSYRRKIKFTRPRGTV